MPKAKEKIKSAERHDRGKSWTSEEEDLLVDFWSWENIKGDTYSTYRIPPFKTNNREYVLFLNAPNQFVFQVIVEWKSSYIPSAFGRAWVYTCMVPVQHTLR